MTSKKMFTFEYVDQVAKTRVLVPETATKYNPEEHFMWFEESDYLATALKGVPYATFKTDDREEMENLLQNGYADKSGVVWKSFFGYWKDQEGHAFLVPSTANINSLEDVGVTTDMKTPADFMKVGKYTNRLFAALPKKEYGGTEAVWGKEFDWMEDEQSALVLLEPRDDMSQEDRTLSIRYVDLKSMKAEEKALVDGCIAINEKAVRALGLSNEPRIGMAWRGTFGTERGLGKGHILYVPHLTYDVVIYGAKTILKTKYFFFGNMGELHVGVPHTDRQAYVNFHYHRPGLGVDLAKTYMRQVFEASKNEAELRRLFLRYTKDMKHADMDQEAWVLRRALAYGVSFLRFPGLYRRVVRYLMKKVMQCDERARIPMDSIANYGYVLPDPNAIDSEGNVDLSKAIPEGTIVFPDVDAGTKVICYRQPSENTNAWVALTVVSKPEFKRFAGRGICLLGRGADKVLGRLGGGDMDDQFVIVHDPKWVEAFHTMRPYPETEKITSEVSEEDIEAHEQDMSELSQFTDELLEDIQDRNYTRYTNKHISWQIDMAKNARAGIGPVVNYGMMDMLMSDPDHKASMLADLKNKPEEWEWLDQREPYQAALLMTNLEIVIDGNVKDTTLLRKLGDVSGTIRDFHKGCWVYPASMASRIPQSKVEKDNYILARSLTCKSLASIHLLRERLMEVFVEREWALVSPADKDLRTYYPYEREISIRVRGEWKRVDGEWTRIGDEQSLMDMWAEGWRDEMLQDQDHEAAYARICKQIQDELEGEDDDMMERLAVELYYQLYKTYQNSPKIDEITGKLRTYPDGLLWSPIFGHHFINALRKSRLSGFYKAAEIRPEYRRRLMDKSVVIEIRSHNVYIQDSDSKFAIWVGFVLGKSPDGKFRMDGGLIQFRKSQPICQPEDYLIAAQQPLIRLYPPKDQEVTKPQDKGPEPKSTFGKLLNKALGILGKK